MRRNRDISEGPVEGPVVEAEGENIEAKLKELRGMKMTLNRSLGPAVAPITVHSPAFIAFYVITSMVIVTGLVLYLKGYF
jgi:hypothetical protein